MSLAARIMAAQTVPAGLERFDAKRGTIRKRLNAIQTWHDEVGFLLIALQDLVTTIYRYNLHTIGRLHTTTAKTTAHCPLPLLLLLLLTIMMRDRY